MMHRLQAKCLAMRSVRSIIPLQIKIKVQNELKAFPVALVKEPYDDGRYKLALGRAQKELRKKITEKDEEEIVQDDEVVFRC